MGQFYLSSETDNNFTSVSNVFIKEYMPDMNGDSVKLYLYLLYKNANADNNLSISMLADVFEQTEKDIVRSLKHCSKRELIKLTFD